MITQAHTSDSGNVHTLIMRYSNFTFLSLLLMLSLAPSNAAASQATTSGTHWQNVVRESPYWASKGAFTNLKTIRRWVLNGESFCENPKRHILFNKSGTFLGYINNEATSAATQQKLNRKRKQLAKAGKVGAWSAGDATSAGYPFALNCDQPNAQMSTALDRYFGTTESARLWGTWDGMRIGDPSHLVALHDAIALVYADRVKKGRISLAPSILTTFAGKTLIESGGQKAAHSAADARGIMQLSLAALNDCGLETRFHFHRMAQIDCALKLMEQNHHNLKPVFNHVFGHLPQAKAQALYNLLLVQAYHGGVGRVSNLIVDPELNQAARYFAKHQKHFSAGDIALGLVFHNLGREQLGFASLYYMADVAVASELACQRQPRMPGCSAPGS